MKNAELTPHWGDRFCVYVLVFGLGFITAMQMGADETREADEKVTYALAAVTRAHAQIDMLKGCTMDDAPASYVEVRHD